MRLPQDPTFESFRPTAGTARAWRLARELASRREGAPQIVFLQGPPGVGKTHLLHATLALAGSERPKSPRVHLPLPELIDRLVEAIQAEQPVARHLGWEGADLVALDDLHLLKGRTVTQRELGRLLVEAAAKGTKVIGAAGGPPADLEDLWAILRRAPRFHSATLRRPHGPEFRNIVASIAGGAPSPTHPTWRAIAASSEGDVRRALGALTRHQFAHNLFATSAPAR